MDKKTIIKKIYFEIFNRAPQNTEVQECLSFLQKNRTKDLVNFLIITKYKKEIEIYKKYKIKYKELKKLKTTEYELIQLSKQYKEVLDKKNEEIARLKNRPRTSYFYLSDLYNYEL